MDSDDSYTGVKSGLNRDVNNLIELTKTVWRAQTMWYYIILWLIARVDA